MVLRRGCTLTPREKMSTAFSLLSPPAATMQTSDMDVASPSKQSDTGHASTPKKNRDKRTSGAPAPADIPPKTPNTETKKIYRTSLVVGPRTREGYATLEEVCENIKRKLLGC